MFTDAYRGRGVSRSMCTYTLTLSLFMLLNLVASLNLVVPSLDFEQTDVF